MSPIGQDTNHALLTSSLAVFAKTVADADFAIVPGDLLAHEFNAKASKALGVAPTSRAAGEMAVKTTLFVAAALADALAGKPAIIALGNVDSNCGDYRIEPGGSYLAATREAVRRLVGAARLAPDFDETYAAGGYYAARHPNDSQRADRGPERRAVVDGIPGCLRQERLRRRTGHDGLAARPARAATRGRRERIWLVHHIPWGIDPYSTVGVPRFELPREGRSFPEGALRLRIPGASRAIPRRDPGELFRSYPFRRLSAADRRSRDCHRPRQAHAGHQPHLRSEYGLSGVHLRPAVGCAERLLDLVSRKSR